MQTLKAHIEKFNAIQQLGNYYFNERQFDKALNCLDQAHKFYHSNNLRINSAFVLSHIGLLKFEVARTNRISSLLLEAATDFAKSAQDFIQINGHRFSWRSTLLEAQSIAEYASLYTVGELAELSFERAQTCFLRAANVVDYLKGLQQVVLSKYDEQFTHVNGFSGHPTDFNKVFTGAFKAAFFGRKRADLALEWVERNKSRRLQTELWRTSNIFAPEDMAYVPGFEELREMLMAYQLDFSTEKMMFCEFFILDQTIILFLIRPEWSGPKYFTLAVQSDEIRREVNTLINDPIANGNMTTALPLIQHILNHSDRDDLLYIIPHGFLHQLPFHMIDVGQGEYLIQRNPVAYLPALSILYHLQNKSKAKEGKVAVKFAVFGNSREDLQFSEDEAIYVSTLLDSDCYLRNSADKDTFINALSHSSVLHFAGHAESEPVKGLDQILLLARQESISARELMLIRNNLELLVLSGCQTGINAIEADTDEIIGFPAAALTAGASAVITTLWKVEDKSTRQFFKYFYESFRNRKLSKIRSLQYAMKALIKNPDYEPFNWAPFIFTGR
ncbi:CHAT domain-containing protein [Mucilaginibacter paludis]|uniref:CHAT domain-containing protein n=1 Tax=Mucilaginibacter paludis DSM 18603 TaxID=714943 RepID=H1YCT7_9SPHI|nr:CHAT domain-containing protein [Mucilaginibacter paludis]EHQ25108.1 hypothetical protein Mucpa_0928 [Mucilaginibacter paludis DSM 18603]